VASLRASPIGSDSGYISAVAIIVKRLIITNCYRIIISMSPQWGFDSYG
jgi:hypothetical protein